MITIKYTLNDIKNLNKNKMSKTNWKQVEKQTDRDIEQACLSDKNGRLLSDYELNKFTSIESMRHKLPLK